MFSSIGYDDCVSYFEQRRLTVLSPLPPQDLQASAFHHVATNSGENTRLRYGYIPISDQQLEKYQKGGLKLYASRPCEGQCAFTGGICSAEFCPSIREGFIPGMGGEAAFPFGKGVYIHQEPPSNVEGKYLMCCILVTAEFVDSIEDCLMHQNVDAYLQNELWIIRNSSQVLPICIATNIDSQLSCINM